MPSYTTKIKIFLPKTKRQTLFILSLLILTAINSIQLGNYFVKIQKIKHILPYQFSGYKFSGLENVLKNVKYVSYYTDKDLNDKKDSQALQQFSQAQYILAPIILDPDNLNHPFILLDCSSEQVAFEKIKELNVRPLKKNKFGIILAKRDL